MEKDCGGGGDEKSENMNLGVDEETSEQSEGSEMDSDPDIRSRSSDDLDGVNGSVNPLGVKSPLDIPEILEMIINKLSNQELLNLRQVSKSLNDKACFYLMKRIDLQEGSGLKSWHWSEMSTTMFEKFCILLSSSSANPDFLLKAVTASSNWDRPTGIPGCENLLQEFGEYVKRLDIQEDVNLEKINKLLISEQCYCPNLEVLVYKASWPKRYLEQCLRIPVFERTLNLKTLQVTMEQNYESPELVELLGSILKSSPYLTSLHIDPEYPIASIDCIDLLQTLPEVTTNLSTFSLDGDVLPNLKALCKVKFSSKLNTVRFSHKFYDHYKFYDRILLVVPEDPFSQDQGLMEFLKLVGPSLETLEVEEDYWGEFHEIPFKNLRNIPEMLNLEELSLNNYKLELRHEPDFFKKLPSLRILTVHSVVDDDLVEFLEVNAQSGVVYENLEEIELSTQDDNDEREMNISSPVTIQQMSQVFPRFSKLRIFVNQLPDDLPIAQWFTQYFHAISQMKHLKDLEITLDIEESNVHTGDVDLTQAFRNLKDSPSLELVHLHRSHRSNFKNFPKKEWVRVAEIMELINAPKLRELTIFCAAMNKEVAENILEEFAERKITVHLEC